jgi:hypothetical protein
VSIRSLAAVLAGVVLALCAPSSAAACSPVPQPPGPPPPPSALIKDYDVAVYGVVASFRILPSTAAPGEPVLADQRFVATVRVTRVFKGWAGRTVRITGGISGAACGFGVVAPRQRVALRLDKPSKPYAVSIASKATLAGLLAATDGRWRAPTGS